MGGENVLKLGYFSLSLDSGCKIERVQTLLYLILLSQNSTGFSETTRITLHELRKIIIAKYLPCVAIRSPACLHCTCVMSDERAMNSWENLMYVNTVVNRVIIPSLQLAVSPAISSNSGEPEEVHLQTVTVVMGLAMS